MKTIFSEEGDIRSVDVLASLVALWREGASGALHFSRSGATAGFQLSAGELTTVTSSDARFETAAILMRAGKLEAANIERLVIPQGGDRALAALNAGILTKREWRWGEKIRAVEVLSDLLTWIEGDYVFDRGAHAEAGEFRLTVPRLILELFLRSRDRGLILHYLGGADVPLARGPHFESEFAAFGLTADAEAVVRLIDGKATAAHIASEGPAEPFAVEKLLAALVTLGLVYPEFVTPEGALRGVTEGALGEVPPPAAAKPADETPAPEPAPVPAEPLAAEAPEAEEEVEDFEEEETGEHPARFNELDVPPTPSAPASMRVGPRLDDELDEDLDEELDQPEASEEVEESAVGDYAIADAGADAVEPTESVSSRDAEPMLEYEPSDEPPESIGVDEPPESAGPTSLEPETKSRLPLDYATGVGSVERPAPRSGARWLWVLVLLAAGVGVVILLRGRGAAPPTGVAATRESPTPAPVPTEETPALSAMAAPTQGAAAVAVATPAQRMAATTIVAPNARASGPPNAPTPAPMAPTVAPRVPTAAPRATARPIATAAPAKTASAQPAPASAETAASRQTWVDRASRDHQKANADRRNHFTIQLELACETQTLVDAWKHDRPAGTMWLLTSPYEGKTCFRVLWGRYPSKEAARRALAGTPSFFSSNHNRPVVTAIR